MTLFHVQNVRSTTLLFVALSITPMLSQAQSDGWSAVRSSGDQATAIYEGGRVNEGDGRAGDRLWIVGENDTLASIAQLTTGSVAHTEALASYNGLTAVSPLTTGQMLYVPADLASVSSSQNSFAWQVQEYDDAPEAEFVEAKYVEPAVRPLTDVMSRNLDYFVGQVDVIGEVSVSRVAVGQGQVVRAEVLKSGELMVIAQQPGSTSLRLWHRDGRQSDYNIRVTESDPQTRVRMEPMVRMKVRMVEFRKSALGRLGIDWSESANGPGFGIAGDAIGNNLFRPAVEGFENLPNTVDPFSTYFGIASNITSRINLLSSNGDAVTLAEPVLTARNGGTASFLAGGEVPYPSVGENGQTIVQFKEYGIKLNVAPQVDEFGQVHAFVDTEISQLDLSVGLEGAPGLLTRRAQTQVNVQSGETIVISGLLSSESSKDVDRVPGIGRLPIIGAFFKSQARRKAVSELVIFVTPEVIEPVNARLAAHDQRVLDVSTEQLGKARAELPLLD